MTPPRPTLPERPWNGLWALDAFCNIGGSDHSAWCATQADAQALADWHMAGEEGPAPVSAVTVAAADDEPVQLDLFAA